MGLKFVDEASTQTRKPFSLKDYFLSSAQRPVCIFPENTKTNRKGVLNCQSQAVRDIFELSKITPSLKIRVHLNKYAFDYFDPKNTTDETGFYKVVSTSFQVWNSVLTYVHDKSMATLNENNWDKRTHGSVEEFQLSVLHSLLCDVDNRISVK